MEAITILVYSSLFSAIIPGSTQDNLGVHRLRNTVLWVCNIPRFYYMMFIQNKRCSSWYECRFCIRRSAIEYLAHGLGQFLCRWRFLRLEPPMEVPLPLQGKSAVELEARVRRISTISMKIFYRYTDIF